jgi:hypothetical protein
LQLNIWQLHWRNEANPNDKEISINGNNVIRIYKLEGGDRGGEKIDRDTELLGYYALRNRLKPKGGLGQK